MATLRRTSTWERVAREPLVHFVFIGLLLFAADAMRRKPRASGETDRLGTAARAPDSSHAAGQQQRRLVVDTAAKSHILAQAERRLGRAPSTGDIAAETEQWIDDEVLYREGMRLGLDRDDPVIHKRVASRMHYVLEQAIIVPEPSETDLRSWFAAHRDQWSVPVRVDFTHVFINGSGAPARARAARLATALAAGAAPGSLGDPFTGGHRYRGRRLSQLARSFGASFADGLDTQPTGTWVIRASRFGLHLVRIDRVEAGRPAVFAAARLDVRKAWRDDHRHKQRRAALARLRAGWTIDRR